MPLIFHHDSKYITYEIFLENSLSFMRDKSKNDRSKSSLKIDSDHHCKACYFTKLGHLYSERGMKDNFLR